ncbi:RNA methyltransferase, TrmH family, group 3 [Blakeslea trispora]|nr:RNA methyltransferase, TrmH family, group 3 [Blakeslea trispora]
MFSRKFVQASATKKWEHVYGLSSVLSALQAKKRTSFETLYYHDTMNNNKVTTPKKDQSLVDTILQLSKASNVPAIRVDKGRLNNMTENKPHQGVVLKASLREPVEISGLTQFTASGTYEAMPRVNKRGSLADRQKNEHMPNIVMEQHKRKPFWIALDEVQDPQNLGSILRTAYFFGVDGVLLCSKNSSPLSPTVSKVSSGALEWMTIYSTPNLVKFLKESNLHGWEIIGAAGEVDSCLNLSQFRDQATQRPTILVLGNEGTGLRTNVRNGCNQFVSIPHAMKHGSVDSLNVGVATGVLVSSALS